ncbi:MAG: LAGLIDADG family homing endonuclease [bacterium]
MTDQAKQRIPWNKGHTKHTHLSVLKISKTLASKPKSNFANWQENHKKTYANVAADADLAELYGIILGDGHIERLARTERLIISCNADHHEQIQHVSDIVGRVFQRQPKIRRRKSCHCHDVYLYEKYISDRLSFPTGRKSVHDLRIPDWIKKEENYLLRCLKGLFETDGNWTIDINNYTNVISFRNNLQGLLDDVFEALKRLGFHPQRRRLDVRLARKQEVLDFVDKTRFMRHSNSGVIQR